MNKKSRVDCSKSGMQSFPSFPIFSVHLFFSFQSFLCNLLIVAVSCPRKGVDLFMHSTCLYTKRAKEFNTSGRLGGLKNYLCMRTRRDPLFSMSAYTASDKRPVEKKAVWPP